MRRYLAARLVQSLIVVLLVTTISFFLIRLAPGDPFSFESAVALSPALRDQLREQFGYRRGDFPVAELLGDTCLALPFSATMTEDDVSYVCDQLAEVIDRQLAHDRVAFQSRRLHVS